MRSSWRAHQVEGRVGHDAGQDHLGVGVHAFFLPPFWLIMGQMRAFLPKPKLGPLQGVFLTDRDRNLAQKALERAAREAREGRDPAFMLDLPGGLPSGHRPWRGGLVLHLPALDAEAGASALTWLDLTRGSGLDRFLFLAAKPGDEEVLLPLARAAMAQGAWIWIYGGVLRYWSIDFLEDLALRGFVLLMRFAQEALEGSPQPAA